MNPTTTVFWKPEHVISAMPHGLVVTVKACMPKPVPAAAPASKN